MAEQPAAGGRTESRIADAAPRGYRVLFELGRGGMGAAFLACAEGPHGFERLVVIKRIRPERVDPRSVERFLREAKLAAAIHHANVVSAQSVGEDAEGPFIVLDYVDGASLEELLDRSLLKQQSMPVPVVLRIALDTLAGLQAVHEACDAQGAPLNVLHRDVSLQNILVGRDGVARLLDFGIARSELGGNTTDQRYIVGKLPYLPPEYLKREPLQPSADVYSLGVTLWLALSGRELWPESSEAQLLHRIVNDGVPPLSQVMQVAPAIVELVGRATSPLRSERFASAREMAASIERLGREHGWLATHHEVAEWLEQVAGVDLARKRERIASSAGEPRSQPAVSPGNFAKTSSELRVPTRGPQPVLVAVVLATLAAVAVAAWSFSRSPPARPAAAESATPHTNAASPAAISVATTPPAPSPAAAPDNVQPTAEAPSASGTATSKAKPPFGHAVKSLVTTAPTSSSARPPSQISKKNPYRD